MILEYCDRKQPPMHCDILIITNHCNCKQIFIVELRTLVKLIVSSQHLQYPLGTFDNGPAVY